MSRIVTRSTTTSATYRTNGPTVISRTAAPVTANTASPAITHATSPAPRLASSQYAMAHAIVAKIPSIEPSAAFAANAGPWSRNRNSVIGPDVNGMPTSHPLIA